MVRPHLFRLWSRQVLTVLTMCSQCTLWLLTMCSRSLTARTQLNREEHRTTEHRRDVPKSHRSWNPNATEAHNWRCFWVLNIRRVSMAWKTELRRKEHAHLSPGHLLLSFLSVCLLHNTGAYRSQNLWGDARYEFEITHSFPICMKHFSLQG